MESSSDRPSLGPPIGYGRTAEVFLWKDNQILKLFREDWPLRFVEQEARIGRAVYETGLPAPAVGEAPSAV